MAEREYNYKAFTPEEVEKGMDLDLIKFLLNENEKFEHRFNDIHITSDGYCTIIEWLDHGYEDYDSGRFDYVNWDQKIMTECYLPDNSTVMCYDEDDVKETFDNWLKEHPTYEKDRWGHWYDASEAHFLDDLKMEQDENSN